jgi:hypothetical protein
MPRIFFTASMRVIVLGGRPVDFQDDVAGLHAGLVGRCVPMGEGMKPEPAVLQG